MVILYLYIDGNIETGLNTTREFEKARIAFTITDHKPLHISQLGCCVFRNASEQRLGNNYLT